MKQVTTIWFALLLTLSVSYGQQSGMLFHSDFEQKAFSSTDPIQILFATNPEIDETKYNEYQWEINATLEKLSLKQNKWSDSRLIEKLYYTIHQRILKRYEQYAPFGDMFASGKYDCVSGTALLAVSLTQLGYSFTIFEFNFHTFLIVNLNDGESILLESTDPLNGVITDNQEIERRIAVYGSGEDSPAKTLKPVATNTDHRSTHINNKVNLLELAGLQYFNLSVKHYNDGNKELAAELIEKAYILYPSERITEIRKIFYAPQLFTTR